MGLIGLGPVDPGSRGCSVDVLYLSREEIISLATLDDVLACVEVAYREKAVGRGVYPLVYEELGAAGLDGFRSNMDIRSGVSPCRGLFGAKLITEFPPDSSDRCGLPAFHSVLQVFDAKTGCLRAVMDGLGVTRLRTGAAAAIGAKWLARNDARTLAVVGTGSQCAPVIASMKRVFSELERVVLWNPRSHERALGRLGSIVDGACSLNPDCARLDIVAEAEGECAIGSADIVVTATGSKAPLFPAACVRSGQHYSCIGADMPSKREVPSGLVKRARVFADDRVRILEFGEMRGAVEEDAILAYRIVGEVGEVIRGERRGRVRPDDVTLFDSCGLATLDITFASLLMERASRQGVGTRLQL